MCVFVEWCIKTRIPDNRRLLILRAHLVSLLYCYNFTNYVL